MTSPPKTLLFLSHAYPEDNGFAAWLAARLTAEGYDVWVDVERLLGGEPVWPRAEKAMRESYRVLYVLSRPSNQKDGTLGELSLGRRLGKESSVDDFVIPLAVDDLPLSDYNIQIENRLAINFFSGGWAPGLKQLLAKLRAIKAPVSTGGEARAESWWREVNASRATVAASPSRHLTNLFRVAHFPPVVHGFAIPDGSSAGDLVLNAKFPMVPSGLKVWSFEEDGASLHPALANVIPSSEGIPARRPPGWDASSATYNAALALFVASFHSHLLARGLLRWEMANQKLCCAFPKGLIEDDKAHFVDGERRSWRTVVGKYKAATWHLGVSAKVLQFPDHVMGVKPHVVFSDDGKTLWPDHEKQHKARRRACKSWWNDRWRDLLLATMSWAADGKGVVDISVGTKTRVAVESAPLALDHPMSLLAEAPTTDEDSDELDLDVDDYEEGDDDDGIADVAITAGDEEDDA